MISTYLCYMYSINCVWSCYKCKLLNFSAVFEISFEIFDFAYFFTKGLSKKDYMSTYTVNLYFAEFIEGVCRVSGRKRRMCPVIEVDDVSPMVTACDVDRVRYCCFSVVFVLKAQYTIRFVGCI